MKNKSFNKLISLNALPGTYIAHLLLRNKKIFFVELEKIVFVDKMQLFIEKRKKGIGSYMKHE